MQLIDDRVFLNIIKNILKNDLKSPTFTNTDIVKNYSNIIYVIDPKNAIFSKIV